METFTAFLMSPENSAFVDQHTHDMTRPLSDYYVSSSHNTYLVGHQLVGVSTIEGYIRALLHSCRSVERESSHHENTDTRLLAEPTFEQWTFSQTLHLHLNP